jgi:ubiquinone/menaquinone biosynthesis C-methylase UbiE
MAAMGRDRDVAAFDRRARSYDQGRVGQWHAGVSRRVADLIVSVDPAPASMLDVGCGTGVLFRELDRRMSLPALTAGIDAAPGMASAAAASVARLPVGVATARAERLPFRDGVFDLVVSSLSFDHWESQAEGVAECARVLRDAGRLVLVDLFSPWLWPTTRVGRRGRARTVAQASRVLGDAGFGAVEWRTVMPFIRAVVASR